VRVRQALIPDGTSVLLRVLERPGAFAQNRRGQDTCARYVQRARGRRHLTLHRYIAGSEDHGWRGISILTGSPGQTFPPDVTVPSTPHPYFGPPRTPRPLISSSKAELTRIEAEFLELPIPFGVGIAQALDVDAAG
jgi:hypothetical protein